MIKTLRITGFIAVILSGVFFVFPVVFGVHGDEKVQQLLNSPGIIEQFSSFKADKSAKDEDQSSPLVRQAQAFAQYLNPTSRGGGKGGHTGQSDRSKRPNQVVPKFTIIGISYCATRPELSLAFINEPGKGLRLLRQSSQIGHLVIEQIKDGLVVIRDGQRTFERAPEKSPGLTKILTSPAESLNRVDKSTISRGSLRRSIPRSASVKPVGARSRAISAQRKPSTGAIKGAIAVKPQLDDEQNPSLEEIIHKLKSLSAKAGGEEEEQIDKIISNLLQAGRISEEEAEKLSDLGEELQDVIPEEQQEEPEEEY